MAPNPYEKENLYIVYGLSLYAFENTNTSLGVTMTSLPRILRSLCLLFVPILLSACVPSNNSPWGGVSTTAPRTTDSSGVVINQGATPEYAGSTMTDGTKIGFAVPLTGKGSDIGNSLLNAAQLAIFDMGIQNIELLPVDTQGSRKGAFGATQQAFSRGADIVLGPLFAEDVKAVNTLSSPMRPIIGFTTDWTAASQNTFVMGFLPHAQVERILSYEIRQGKKNFALVVPQTEYGRLISSSAQRLLKSNNLSQAQVMNSGQELASFLQSGQKIDSVLIGMAAPEASQIVNAINATSQRPQILGTGLWQEPSAVNYPSLNGALYASPSPNYKAQFEQNYRSNFGRFPEALTSLGYDATALIISFTKLGIKPTSQALTSPEGFKGINGAFKFRADGLVERSLSVIQISGGSRRVVEEGSRNLNTTTN